MVNGNQPASTSMSLLYLIQMCDFFSDREDDLDVLPSQRFRDVSHRRIVLTERSQDRCKMQCITLW